MEEKVVCTTCQGSGKCPRCLGSGSVSQNVPGPMSVISGNVRSGSRTGQRRSCSRCYGSGTCQTCKGTGKAS